MTDAGKDRRIMRKKYRWGKILTVTVLCMALVLHAAACGAADTSGLAEQENAAAQAPDAENAKEAVSFKPDADAPCVTPGEKEETVYVKADAAGVPTQKTVEVVLRQIDGKDAIEDRSDLREIKNTESDEEFVEAGGGRYLWENKGEDIHYKGISDKQIPVNVKVTYYLEGQEIPARDLAGKTGKVKIRFDYENSTDVPFMALSSVILSSDVFRDVEVTGGRVLDMGDQKMVIGFAFPGLMDTLALREYEPTEEIDLPEYVEIEARAEAFELDFTATVVSTGLFEDIEDKDLEDMEELSDDMDELTDASEEITDAAGELADAGAQMEDYLYQYFDGVSQLSEGTSQLDQGLAALSQNISKIGEGANSLQKGLEQVDSSLSEIDLSALTSEESAASAEAVKEALEAMGLGCAALGEKLAAAQSSLETVRTFSDEVQTYIGQVQALQRAVADNPAPDLAARDLEEGWTEALNKEASSQAAEKAQAAAQKAASDAVSAAAQKAADATAQKAKDTVKEKIEKSGALDDCGLTDAQKEKIKQELISDIQDWVAASGADETEVKAETPEVEIALDAVFGEIRDRIQKDGEGRSNEIKEASAKIAEPAIPDMQGLSEEKMQEITQIISGMEASLAVVSAYAQGMSCVTSSLTELSTALSQLQEGVSQLSEGSSSLAEGLSVFETALAKASEGSSQLDSAMRTVSSAGGALGSAFGELADGLGEFADGIAEFDEEGIQSLAELTGPEYKNVIRAVRAARDAERSYTNYSGILEGQKGSVKFIIETGEISKNT